MEREARHRAFLIFGNLPLLEQVSFDSVKALSAAARLSTACPGVRLLQQDAPLSDVVFVLRGVVRVLYGDALGEYTPKILVAPSLLGHLEMLTNQPTALASVDVVQECWIARISWPVFLELLSSDHALALAVLEDLAMDFLLAANAARQAAFGGLPNRIANVLLSYADVQSAQGIDGDTTPLPINHQQLARHVASPRRSVLRVTQSMHDEGLICDIGGRIVVRDVRRLRGKLCPTSRGLTHRFRPPLLRK